MMHLLDVCTEHERDSGGEKNRGDVEIVILIVMEASLRPLPAGYLSVSFPYVWLSLQCFHPTECLESLKESTDQW